MDQNRLSRCFRCGKESSRLFAYVRLGENEAILGAVNRAVCDECLAKYIEEIKSGRKGRYRFLSPLIPMLTMGSLLTAFAESGFWRGAGILLLIAAAAVTAMAVRDHVREVKRAREASMEENMKKYAPQMCVEDARKGQQGKLVEMKLEYATGEYPVERIAKEAKVSVETAMRMKLIVLKAFADAAASPNGTAG
jgi:hypothetical protein